MVRYELKSVRSLVSTNIKALCGARCKDTQERLRQGRRILLEKEGETGGFSWRYVRSFGIIIDGCLRKELGRVQSMGRRPDKTGETSSDLGFSD